jgi:hypothetical protein
LFFGAAALNATHSLTVIYLRLIRLESAKLDQCFLCPCLRHSARLGKFTDDSDNNNNDNQNVVCSNTKTTDTQSSVSARQ